MATARRFRKLALACDGAIEGSHHDHADFRANGRIFATLHPGGARAMVKLTPPQQTRCLAALGDAAVPASGAWGRQGCTLVTLAEVDADTLAGFVLEAWQNVMQASPKKAAQKKAAKK